MPYQQLRSLQILTSTGEGHRDSAGWSSFAPGEDHPSPIRRREFIGGRNPHHHHDEGNRRSSRGRNFIRVCKCAGWVTSAACDRWLTEITNNSGAVPHRSSSGRRIAQILAVLGTGMRSLANKHARRVRGTRRAASLRAVRVGFLRAPASPPSWDRDIKE